MVHKGKKNRESRKDRKKGLVFKNKNKYISDIEKQRTESSESEEPEEQKADNDTIIWVDKSTHY